MDAWETWDTMAKLFTEIVAGHKMIEEMEETDVIDPEAPTVGQLTKAVDKNFKRLKAFYQGGKHFDQVGYVGQLRQKIVDAEKADDRDTAWKCFYDYCELLEAIWNLRDFRELIILFRQTDLDEWTKLSLDTQSLRFFAIKFIEGVQEIRDLGGEISAEVAFYVKTVAELYSVDLSLELRATINFILRALPEDEDTEEDGEDGSSVMLQ